LSFEILSVNLLSSDGTARALPHETDTVSLDSSRRILSFRFSEEISPDPARLEITFRIPIAGVHGIWSPIRTSHPGNQCSLSWAHEFHSSAALTPSIAAFVNRDLKTQAMLALAEQAAETAWSISLSQAGECYFAKFAYPDSGSLPVESWDTISFYIEDNSADRSVIESVALVTEYIMAQSPRPASAKVPDWAWDPVYCTWYAAHATIDADWVERTAAIAAKLGFGQIILDDGWQRAERARVTTMANLKDWFAKTGDWIAAPEEFPNFPEHVKRVQSLGLKYILWWDPYGIGRESSAYRKFASRVSAQDWEPEGRRYLCVQDEVASQHIIDTGARLVSDYDVDGFKVDFLYAVDTHICEIDGHSHFEPTVSRALMRTMADLLDAVLTAKPEFNMVHVGGPVLTTVANSMRGVDVPFDVDSNLYFLAYSQAMTANVPLQSDPLFWSSEDSAEEVARHLISSVFFVPCISMDLAALSERDLDLIGAWMGFYRQHKDVLRAAARRVTTVGPVISSVVAETYELDIVGLFRPLPVDIRGVKETIVLNASASAEVVVCGGSGGSFKAIIYDPRLRFVCERRVALSGYTTIQVPAGGYMRLIEE